MLIAGSESKFFDSTRKRIAEKLGPLKFAAGPMSRILGVDELEDFYVKLNKRNEPTFEEKILAELGGEMEWDRRQLENFPKSGPVLVSAVHPTGLRESIIMKVIRATGRTDIKIMTTVMLKEVEEIRPYSIFVDNLGLPSRPKKRSKIGEPKTLEEIEYEKKRDQRRLFNLNAKAEALKWLQEGHVLIIFPAGAVSYFQADKGKVLDPEWTLTIAEFIRASRANVVPAYFGGQNSLGFQIFGQIETIRTMLLFREFLGKRGKKFSIQIGDPLPYDRLKDFENDRSLVDYIRAQTYALQLIEKVKKQSDLKVSKLSFEKNIEDPIDIKPAMRGIIEKMENAEKGNQALPENILIRSKERIVCVFKGNEIPQMIDKLGYRRAINFLRVGEGNGEKDNDRFDNIYHHIVSYNLANEEIEGAYRLGLIRSLVTQHGLKGSYLHQFLDFPRSMVDSGPLKYAAELGRAFVEKKYEGEALFPLWKGIAEFIYRQKNIFNLVGVVSMSNEYTPMSQLLAVKYMQKNIPAKELKKSFKSRTPPKLPNSDFIIEEFLRCGTFNLDDVDRIVKHIDSVGLPPLLKFYSGIGARVLNPNLDEDFNSLDIPVIVQLYKNEAPLVKRAFGLSKFQELQKHWAEIQ